MSYNIETIKTSWLVVGTIPYSEEQVVIAFNEVYATLGQEALDRVKFIGGIEQHGPHVTIIVVELGLKLGILKKGINFNSLIEKLKSPHENLRKKGMAELNAIYFFCKDGNVDFELEPTVSRVGRTPSMPDFRLKLRSENNWTYVEVKQPDTSEENLAMQTVIQRIVKLFSSNTNILSIEVMLLRIPTEEELVHIEQRCISEYDPNQVKEFEIETLGLIKMSNETNVNYAPTDYKGFIGESVLGTFQTRVETIPSGKVIVKQSVACRIAFSDQRAVRFLINASDQLPISSSNLIWIDGAHVPSMKKWPTYFLKRFNDKPELNRSISGVVTFRGGIGLHESMIAVKNSITLTENHSADFSTPSWISEKITAANKMYKS